MKDEVVKYIVKKNVKQIMLKWRFRLNVGLRIEKNMCPSVL